MIIKIFGLAFLFAASSFILKAFGWRGAPLVAIGSVIMLIFLFFERFSTVIEIFEVIKEVNGAGESVECILKILGVGYVSGISSDICKELGEASIASAVSLIARIECIAIVSPMIIEILTLGLELVE